ncbi:MAG TPA: hydrogenase maturation protease [Terriglobales bacterium]|nr:hydrogenase maturation protease [Terriglobales bacterium]
MKTSRSNAPPTPKHVCVIGLGNVLMGDDGFGSLAVEEFRCEYECGSNVEILDLGTPGLDLAPYLYGTDLVIIADAVQPHEKEKPGTLCIYREDDLLAQRAQLRLTAHDPGLQESLVQLRLVGHAPFELIIVGVVPESCDFGKGISSAVLNTSLAAVDHLACLLVERGIECRRRRTPVQPNLWWLLGHRSRFLPQKSDSQDYRVPEDMFSTSQTVGR